METSRRSSLLPLALVPLIACAHKPASIPDPISSSDNLPTHEALQFCEALRTAAGFEDHLGAGMSGGDPSTLSIEIQRYAEMSSAQDAPYVVCTWEVDEAEFNAGKPIPKPAHGDDLPRYYGAASDQLRAYIKSHGPIVPKKRRKLSGVSVSQTGEQREHKRFFDGEPLGSPDGVLDDVSIHKDIMGPSIGCGNEPMISVDKSEGWSRCLEVFRRKEEFNGEYRRVMRGFLEGFRRGQVQPYSRFNRER